MAAITSAQTSPADFLLARVKRIVPAYWIATSVFLAGVVLGLFPNARIDPWFVISSYIFVPSIGPGAKEIWPLLVPGWTLNYEMFFYAVFAAALLLRKSSFGLLITLFLGGLVAWGTVVALEQPAAVFYTRPILLEFVAGLWLGLFWKEKGAPAGGWGAIGLAALLLAAAWWADTDSWRLFRFGIPALLLLVGVLGIEQRLGQLPRLWPLNLIGDASYSIYLWHTMILAVAIKIAKTAGFGSIPATLFGIIAGVSGGVVAYLIIEAPLQAWFKRRKQAARQA